MHFQNEGISITLPVKSWEEKICPFRLGKLSNFIFLSPLHIPEIIPCSPRRTALSWHFLFFWVFSIHVHIHTQNVSAILCYPSLVAFNRAYQRQEKMRFGSVDLLQPAKIKCDSSRPAQQEVSMTAERLETQTCATDEHYPNISHIVSVRDHF